MIQKLSFPDYLHPLAVHTSSPSAAGTNPEIIATLLSGTRDRLFRCNQPEKNTMNKPRG